MSGSPPPLPDPSSSSQSLQATLLSKLKWLMFFRILLATILFGSAVVVQLRDAREGYSSLLYSLIVAIYLFSAIYAAILNRVRNLTVFAYVQFFADALFITPLIYVTGGIESIFSFLYFLTIISASYLLYTPGAFYAAALSGVFYGLLVGLQAWHVVPAYPGNSPAAPLDVSYIFYNITINVFAFFLVAFLSSYLAEQLKRTKEALLEEQLNLRELEEFNRKIVENIKSGILTLDSQGRITFLNRAAQEMSGFTLDSVFGTPVDQIFPSTSAYLTDIHLDGDAVLRSTRWERHFTRKDKQRLYLGFSTSPLRNPDGREVGKILIFEDLTRIKHLEEKARRDDRLKTIGRLAAGIAHEIRNPLASISGSIQLLRNELDLRDENRTLMDIVIRETDRLNALLTDFLQYVRQSPLAKHPIELDKLILEVLEALRHNPKFVDTIRVETSFQHRCRLEADPSQLRQVIWNLTLNAIEVMPEGGTLSVTTRDLPSYPDDPTPRIEIAVGDTGPGIDASIQENIFDPFFSTKTGGTGLGLALVEKIIQSHDGLVRARAARERGTVFEVNLPALSPSPFSTPNAQPEEGSLANAG